MCFLGPPGPQTSPITFYRAIGENVTKGRGLPSYQNNYKQRELFQTYFLIFVLLDPPPPPRPAFKVYRRHCQVSHLAKNAAAIKEKEFYQKFSTKALVGRYKTCELSLVKVSIISGPS